MSIQAVAWALEQDFSYRTPKGHQRCCHAAKLVLISLANHADHTSGHCWPSAATIAREASCAEHYVYRMVAALARNGFIDMKKAKGADGKQRSNNYWIRFDRPPAPWQFFSGDDDNAPDEPGDSNEPGNTESPGGNDDIYGGCESKTDSESPGPGDVRVTRHIMIEPSVIEPSESEQVDRAPIAPVPPPTAPKGFDSRNRQREIALQQAAEEARRPSHHPVIQGSAPWAAWVKAGHKPGLVGTIKLANDRLDRGWYFPTLWPPKETGPPAPDLLEQSQAPPTKKTG